MEVSLAPNQTLLIETSVVTLRGGPPIVNGVPLEGWIFEVLHLDSEHMELRYTSPSLDGGAFQIQANHSESQNRCGYITRWKDCPRIPFWIRLACASSGWRTCDSFSAHRLTLWRLILPEQRASCDFPLLRESDIFYEQLPENNQTNDVRHMPRAEDVMLVQVRHPKRVKTPGAIFFSNPSNHTVQRNYSLAYLRIKDSAYLYHWGTDLQVKKT